MYCRAGGEEDNEDHVPYSPMSQEAAQEEVRFPSCALADSLTGGSKVYCRQIRPSPQLGCFTDEASALVFLLDVSAKSSLALNSWFVLLCK